MKKLVMVITDRGLVSDVLLLPEKVSDHSAILDAWKKKYITRDPAYGVKYQIRELNETWK